MVPDIARCVGRRQPAALGSHATTPKSHRYSPRASPCVAAPRAWDGVRPSRPQRAEWVEPFTRFASRRGHPTSAPRLRAGSGMGGSGTWGSPLICRDFMMLAKGFHPFR
jgi:hypothetical protein